MVDVERCLSYKGICHVILLAKLHAMYLYKTDNFYHTNHYLKSVSKVALLHRFHCTPIMWRTVFTNATSFFSFFLFFIFCHILFKVNDYTFRGDNYVKIVLSPSEMGSILKGKQKWSNKSCLPW